MALRPKTIRQAERLRRRVGAAVGVVIRVAAVVAAVFQTLFSLKVLVDWSYWWVLAPLVIAVGGTALEGIVKLLGLSQHHLRRDQVDDVRGALSQLAIDVKETTKLPLEHVGASVWLVRSFPPWLWSKRLDRIVRFRISDYPPPSDIDWTPGKGTIGRCWKEARPKHQSWRELIRKYGSDPTEGQWAEMEEQGEVARAGLSMADFKALFGKYSEVYAYPIQDRRGSAVIGVVSIDIPIDSIEDDDNEDHLGSIQVRLAAHAAASVIYRVVQA